MVDTETLRRILKETLATGVRHPARAEGRRRAGVLLLVYEKDGRLHILFTRRAAGVQRHAGEISLPGGEIEPGEASALDAALRETREEIGVSVRKDQVLGRLGDMDIPVSNFLVTPFVVLLDDAPQPTPEGAEVSEVIELPVGELSNPSILRRRTFTRGDVSRSLWFFEHPKYTIWGATAKILKEFLELDALQEWRAL
ncbi:MAG: NUDIX hydrolase [Candidatus Geothermarchaeales archaeon]